MSFWCWLSRFLYCCFISIHYKWRSNSYQYWESHTIVLELHIQTLDVPRALTHGSYFFKAVCVPNCQNGGLCVKPDQCSCRSGWVGSRCSKGKPYPSEYRDTVAPTAWHTWIPLAFNGRKIKGLLPANMCKLHVDFSMNYCRNHFFVLVALCAVSCQNGGTCVAPERCKCRPGYTGVACETGW